MNMTERLHRINGVMIGAACGDALGVPYEFMPRIDDDERPEMIGGGLGPYEPGEWSDDTQMQICVAQAVANGGDANHRTVLDTIAQNFISWRKDGASDIGSQTLGVITRTTKTGVPRGHSSVVMADAAMKLHYATGLSAGNGSLMRTGVLALAYLDAPVELARAARNVSDLTHYDPLAGDACVLWCEAIRVAIMDGRLAMFSGLGYVPYQRRAFWRDALHRAVSAPPWAFNKNGYVVEALQAAYSAVVKNASSFEDTIIDAVRAGTDTDTVAAIAGALAGPLYGFNKIPAEWIRSVHGWPGMDAFDLFELARDIVRTH